MHSFLLALLGGAFGFGNLVRLLNPVIPLRKDPADNWNCLYSIAYWPMYAGQIFPSLAAVELCLVLGQFNTAGRAAGRMFLGLFSWDTKRVLKQVLTLVSWLLWGYWMSRNAPIEPKTFWPLFVMAGPLVWFVVAPILLLLFLYLAYELPLHRSKTLITIPESTAIN